MYVFDKVNGDTGFFRRLGRDEEVCDARLTEAPTPHIYMSRSLQFVGLCYVFLVYVPPPIVSFCLAGHATLSLFTTGNPWLGTSYSELV